MSAEFPVNKNKKRQRHKKSNRRFISNAKGFARKGIFGRGSHIDDDQIKYFINTLDAMKNGFEDVTDKENMANNVFEFTKEQEVHIASNQIGSKVLESLIGFVDAETLERFFDAFSENFRIVCSDHFASHVLQKIIEIAFLRFVVAANKKPEEHEEGIEAKRIKVDLLSEENFNLTTTFSTEHKEKCGKFVLRIGKFVLNNLEDFVWDAYASHIMRTCIFSLAGMHVPKVAFQKSAAEVDKIRNVYTVPEEWIEVMKEYPQRLEMWPQFVDFPYQDHSSALISVICLTLKTVDKKLLKNFGKKILEVCFLKEKVSKDNEESEETTVLPQVFECQSSVRLLETLLSVSEPKLFKKLYTKLFDGHIAQLACAQLTNFAVTKLLQKLTEKEHFEQIFTELAPHIEELLKIGHTAVVVALTGACLRLSTKQAQMISALQSALHLAGDKEKLKLFFLCMIKLKPYNITLEDKTNFVHLHGSLMLQDILRFNKPIFLITCILETSADQLAAIFNTPNGSHIVDAFVQSKFVGEKSREKFIRLLEGFYIDLGITKFGSRVVENLFAVAQEPQKLRIAKELSEKSNMLKSTVFGRFLFSKLRIETYMLSVAQWKVAILQQKGNKAEKLFKDIIN